MKMDTVATFLGCSTNESLDLEVENARAKL